MGACTNANAPTPPPPTLQWVYIPPLAVIAGTSQLRFHRGLKHSNTPAQLTPVAGAVIHMYVVLQAPTSTARLFFVLQYNSRGSSLVHLE